MRMDSAVAQILLRSSDPIQWQCLNDIIAASSLRELEGEMVVKWPRRDPNCRCRPVAIVSSLAVF